MITRATAAGLILGALLARATTAASVGAMEPAILSGTECLGATPTGAMAFVLDDGQHGTEPWLADVAAGTARLVADLHPGGSSDPELLAWVGRRLLLTADDGVHGRQLMVVDPAVPGITSLTPTAPAVDPTSVYEESDELGDPVKVTTRILGVVNGATIVAVGRVGSDIDLVSTDGTVDGTDTIGVVPRDGFMNLRPLGVSPTSLWFGDGSHLWVTDGTEIGTHTVATPAGFGVALGIAGERFVFAAPGASADRSGTLWVTDGSVSGTRNLGEVHPAELLGAVVDRLVFSADDGLHGLQPWVTDGTVEGTHRLFDTQRKGATRIDRFGTAADGSLLFTRWDQRRRLSLWSTDGTAPGTRRLGRLASELPGAPEGSVAVGDRLFLIDWQGSGGGQLGDRSGPAPRAWLALSESPFSDVQRVRRLPAAPSGFGPAFLGVAGGRIVFAASKARRPDQEDPDIGVWSSDGTRGGTRRLTRLRSVEQSWRGDSIAVPSLLVASDGQRLVFHDLAGQRLWATDGTPAGTRTIARGLVHALLAQAEDGHEAPSSCPTPPSQRSAD